MSTKYKTGSEVPTKVLSERLDDLSDIFSSETDSNILREVRIHIPVQLDHDADLVLSIAAKRLLVLEKKLAWFKMVYGKGESSVSSEDLEKLNKTESKALIIERLTIEANKGIECEISGVEAVRFRMEQYGLNQKEFASIIGITPPKLSEFLSGKRRLSKRSIRRCIAIGVSKDALLSDM